MTEEEKYCEDMRDLFLMQGWKNLVEELEALVASAEVISSVSTLEQLHFNKGAISVADSILRLPIDIELSEQGDEEYVH